MTLDATVVIPTFRRLDRLEECLRALRGQSRPAEEVLVVVHQSDEPTARRVAELAALWPELRSTRVDGSGLVAALNRGLAEASGTVVAFIDDDAVASPDWLGRILATFAEDERIAAVGGRDIVVHDGRIDGDRRSTFFGWRRYPPEVGRIQWFGRMIANHHIGAGTARDVDVLKGVNMSVRRRPALSHGFDERLRGRGATVHSELSICLPLRREGMRVVYDPRIEVHHYPAPRPRGDHRRNQDRDTAIAAAHNEALEILDYLSPGQRIAFALWGVLVGCTGGPGMAILARDLFARRQGAWRRFEAAQRGRAAAWRTRREPRVIPSSLTRQLG